MFIFFQGISLPVPPTLEPLETKMPQRVLSNPYVIDFLKVFYIFFLFKMSYIKMNNKDPFETILAARSFPPNLYNKKLYFNKKIHYYFLYNKQSDCERTFDLEILAIQINIICIRNSNEIGIYTLQTNLKNYRYKILE